MVSKELLDIFKENDFILFTETWTSKVSDISVPNFHPIRLDRVDKKQRTKGNSGGIALYIKETIYKNTKLIKYDSDDIIWLKIDGHVFNLSFDLYLCLCYIIPSGSSREALVEMNVIDRISEFIIQIANETKNSYNY